MNSEFPIRALADEQTPQERFIEGENALAALNRTGKPLPKTTAEMVLGHKPYNRHDRRKAANLLRQKG